MTPAARYLNSRGIVLRPPSLRSAAEVWHPYAEICLPALLAAVQGPDRRIIALHVTYLRADGTKARVYAPRLTVGQLGTGAVRFGPAGDVLGIAEGIETALSAMQIHCVPVWASLGAARLGRITLPPDVRTVIVFADNDGPGFNAAARAEARHRSEGRHVEIRRPPECFNDWNDVLRARQGRAA